MMGTAEWRTLPLVALLLAGIEHSSAARVSDGPIQKTIALLGELQTKLIKEGDEETANFEAFTRFCEKGSTEKQYTIKDRKEQITTLSATAQTASSEIEELNAMVEKLSSEISTNEAEAKQAHAVREKEHQDFLKRDGDLGMTVDMLARAHRVLEANLKPGANAGAMAAQLAQVTSTLRKVVDASFVELEDHAVIEALLQQSEDQEDGSADLDLQPQASADAYQEKSSGILDTIASMEEKAQVARNEQQKQEMKAQHNFEMLMQSTGSELATLKKQLDDCKKNKNKNEEVKATASGELELVQKDLSGDEAYLGDLQKDCMTRADEFEIESKERAAEIKVLKEARTILMKAAKGAFVQEPGGALAFVQTGSQTKMASRARAQMLMERQRQAADYLASLGEQSNNWVLTQVGNRLQQDPFAKVKEMVQAMVEKLLAEQAEEAEHKAWCDSELGKTSKSLQGQQDKLNTINTRIEAAKAASAELGEQVKVLIQEIAELDSNMQEATRMRQKENGEFLRVKKDLEKFQQATATAIQVLRNYYEGKSFLQEDATADASMSSLMSGGSSAAQPAGSAASSIIGMLEVAESDFSKALADAVAAEDASQQEYDKMMQDSKVSRAEKEADSKGKSSEKDRLDSLASQTELDAKDSQEELGAVTEYMEKLKGSCETKAPSTEERAARRKQEMDGLQNALAILEGKGIALFQEPSALQLLRR